MSEIQDQIASYIAAEILKDPGREIAPDEPLISSGLIDSFSLVDLALFIEDTFGVRIDDAELTADVFDTLEQLTGLVQARQDPQT
ncbi:MAG: acyl carrier protein [Anaerolineales bacterium]